MKEKWMSSKWFPNYQVSTAGRIRSIGKSITQISRTGNPYVRDFPGKLLAVKTKRYSSGRFKRIDGKTISAVHRMVYEFFNGPIPDGMCINHLNGNIKDNRIANLELCTPKENSFHAVAMGLRKYKTHCSRGHKFTTKTTRYIKSTAHIGNIKRVCRICTNERSKIYYHTNKGDRE